MSIRIMVGDCMERLRDLPAESVDCCVTSPPYYGLRDYGHAGQIGLEETPQAYVERLVDVFREVRRVLKPVGTLWLNLGDSYSNGGRSSRAADSSVRAACAMSCRPADGMKPKDLIGIPWRVAFALQADGWWLRQDIIWSKPNPMPESVTDRCTKAHEYVFLLSKSERYWFDQKAIAEPLAPATIARLSQVGLADQNGSDRVPGKTNGNMKAAPPRFGGSKYGDNEDAEHRTKSGREYSVSEGGLRNRRTVWSIATQPFTGAHFATMPPDLARDCIRAGCPAGGVVLDPFGGAGTTGLAANREQRSAVLFELNPEYAAISRQRIAEDGGWFAQVEVLP